MNERLDRAANWIEHHPVAFAIVTIAAFGLANTIVSKLPTIVKYKVIRK